MGSELKIGNFADYRNLPLDSTETRWRIGAVGVEAAYGYYGSCLGVDRGGPVRLILAGTRFLPGARVEFYRRHHRRSY